MKGKHPAVFYLLSPLIIGLLLLAAYFFLIFLPQEGREARARLAAAEKSLRREARLTLAEQQYRAVMHIENARNFFGIKIPLNRLLFSVDYRLRGGIMLDENFSLKLNSLNGVTVRYGPPQIFSVDALDDTIESYSAQALPLTQIRQSSFLPALKNEQEKIKQKALDEGLEAFIIKNAEFFFTAFLSAAGFEQIEFEVIR
jgi:hypothetical protein